MLLLPSRIFQQCHPLPAEPLLQEDYQKLSSPTASFTASFEPEDESLPNTKTSELTELLLRTSAALDHDDKARHDEEVADEIHIVLFRALHESTVESYESEDIVLALDSIEKLLRCSDHVARETFAGGCGVPLLQLIFLLFEMNYRLGNPHIVCSCKSIIGRFVSLGTDLTAMYRSSEFLSFLVIAIEGTSGNETVQCASLSLESLSRQLVNKPILVNRRDVCDCLFGMVDSYLPGKARAVATRSIMNLVTDFPPGIKVYTNNQVYVDILIKATLDDEDEVRAGAVETLLILSASHVEIQASLLNSSEKENILDRLLLVAEDFTNADHTRVCALRAFVSLVKGRRVPTAAEDSILHLRNVVLGSNDVIATQAAIAIKTTLALLTFYDHPSLLVALDSVVEMSSSSCLQVQMWSARAIREQALDPSNHCLMLSADDFLTALVQLSQNCHPSICRPALESIHSLARNGVGAVAIAKAEMLLSTLVDVASSESNDKQSDSVGRRIAMEALIALVTNADALVLIVSKRDIFVDILMELSLFGCGKVGEKALRAGAMEAVALLANYL